MCFTFLFSILLCTFLFLEFPSCFIPTTASALFMCMLWFYFYFAFTFVLILLMCLLQLCLCVYFDFIHAFLPHIHFCVTPSTSLLHLFQLNLLLFLFFGLIPTLIFELCSCICSYFTSPTSNLCMFQPHCCVCSNFVLTCLLPCHHYVQVFFYLALASLVSLLSFIFA